jgi:hypothetical protein
VSPARQAASVLCADIGIGLATGMTALGMTDDRMAATGILQHLGADAAGEGAFRLGMAVLSTQRDIAAGERLADRDEQCGRRTDKELAAMRLASPRRGHRGPGREHRRAGPFIFQLPATSRLRSAISNPLNTSEADAGDPLRPGNRSLYIPLNDHIGTPMLQAIRTRAGSIIVKVLFGLLIISFGFWGIYTRSDYFQGTRRKPSSLPSATTISVRTICSASCSRHWNGFALSSAARSTSSRSSNSASSTTCSRS